MVLVGYIMIGMGMALIMLGVIAAGLSLGRKQGQGLAAADAGIVDILKAIPNIIKELAAAPPWLGFTLVGLALLLLGVQRVDGGWPFNLSASPAHSAAPAASATS